MLCISSIVFLVVLALHVVTAARRAPGIGDFERVLASCPCAGQCGYVCFLPNCGSSLLYINKRSVQEGLDCGAYLAKPPSAPVD